jgi:ankyrin repeat protein
LGLALFNSTTRFDDFSVRELNPPSAASVSAPAVELLAAGADVNASRKDNGITVLMSAVRSGNPEVIRLLLAAGAAPEAFDKDGQQAIDKARQKDMPQIIDLLEQ